MKARKMLLGKLDSRDSTSAQNDAPVSRPQVTVVCTGDVVLCILPASRLLHARRRQRLVEWSAIFLCRSVIVATVKSIW
jgi:hypothetical protein